MEKTINPARLAVWNGIRLSFLCVIALSFLVLYLKDLQQEPLTLGVGFGIFVLCWVAEMWDGSSITTTKVESGHIYFTCGNAEEKGSSKLQIILNSFWQHLAFGIGVTGAAVVATLTFAFVLQLFF
jgi:hypothetical protein